MAASLKIKSLLRICYNKILWLKFGATSLGAQFILLYLELDLGVFSKLCQID